MIKLPKEIQDNLQFLCVEIDSQLANMQQYFKQVKPSLGNRILDRVGYVYNLKTRIQNSVFHQLSTQGLDNQTILSLRSIELISNDLGRIIDICRSCVVETDSLSQLDGLLPKTTVKILRQMRQAVQLVIPAVEHTDSTMAIQIGQMMDALTDEHHKLYQKNIAALKSHKNPARMTAAVYVAHELKQMSATLMHICEAIISANLGQQVSFDRYFSLQSVVSALDKDEQKVQLQTVAETRSGAAISGISSPESGALGIYKSGQKQKLKEEREGVKSWNEIYPGVAPKILSYKKKGGSAALLIEHLPGLTFEKIVLNEPVASIEVAQLKLHKTLRSIWTATKLEKSSQAHFMRQLQTRLPEVYKIHPEFYQPQVNICGQQLPAFDTLIAQAAEQEQAWPSTFTVYIHGDFNDDNIIYDPITQRINFIDLHRSCYMDYVQDISVFMVSNYRLQILDSLRRQYIMTVAINMYTMARRYALKYDDTSFELRLALGLARSFATSTRFILDKTLAQNMFLRARYLIELVLAVDPDKVSRFRIPLKEIFVE
ncbi:MAG: aminoglycoside phosphotransferase family protein [Methylophilaceae bacterium]